MGSKEYRFLKKPEEDSKPKKEEELISDDEEKIKGFRFLGNEKDSYSLSEEPLSPVSKPSFSFLKDKAPKQEDIAPKPKPKITLHTVHDSPVQNTITPYDIPGLSYEPLKMNINPALKDLRNEIMALYQLGMYPIPPMGAGDSQVSDVAYGSSWNGVGTFAPSKNVVYDKIEALTLATSNQISDTAYGVSWDNVTTKSPSKNALYDIIETLATKATVDGIHSAMQDPTGFYNRTDSDFTFDDSERLLTVTASSTTFAI